MNVVYDTSVSREDYKHQKGVGIVCCVCVLRGSRSQCVIVRPGWLIKGLARARVSLLLLRPVKGEVGCAMTSRQSAKLTLIPDDFEQSYPGQ